MKKSVRVMGFGTFDQLHPGHVSFLRQLMALGDELLVVVARDHNVKKIKGRLPLQTEGERLAAMRATGLADRVILGNPSDFYQCLRDYRPDVIGLGYDQAANISAIKRVLPGIKTVRLKAFKPQSYKSSLLARRKARLAKTV